MTGLTTSAETRLNRLLERLLGAAEASLAAGELEPARATAEEVCAVDPDNRRAAAILQRVATHQRGRSGERALMTLLFSDLVGSTMLSERVEPEQLRDLYSFYRTAAREAVERYGGSVIQYTGDGILAGFGHPQPHEDDARRAVLAGLDLGVALRDARADLDSRLDVSPEVRVGIHTGRVVVTDLSDDDSVAERDSIVGLVPNLAARIQQAADPGTVVISDVTRQLVDADFFLHSLGEPALKGISRPVELFTVERPRYAGARSQTERYRQAGLIGRDEPRGRLLSAWQDVARTAGGAAADVCLVVGEAGIGKSRLVAELLDRAEATGGRVLGAACLPYYANVSLWPIARMLDRMLGRAGQDADRLAWLVGQLGAVGLDPARAVPFLGPLVGISATAQYPAPELEPSAALDETLNRLVDWLAAVAGRRPHLLVVEDLHWADPSTLGLLGRLAARRPASVLTVATARDDAVIPWRNSVRVLELGRLDGVAAGRMIDNLAGGKRLTGDQRAAILEHSDGIPLFIEELTRSGLDERRSEPMPLRLQELLTWRLKAPGVDLRVVQVAATIGPTFDAEAVSAVVGDERAVAEQLEVLAGAGVVEPIALAAGSYRFRHALMRDAAYETQVLDVRRRTHAEVADALAAGGAEPALIALHLDLAGQVTQAVVRYLAAAQAEQGRGAYAEVTRLASRALELLESLPESDDRDSSELTARMLRGLSVSSMHGYTAPVAESDHRRAEALATRLGRPEVLPALIALWGYRLVSGTLATAPGLIDRLTAMVRQPAFAEFAPEVETCIGFTDLHRGRLESAGRHLERALAGLTARDPGETVSTVWSLPHDPVAATAVALACVRSARGEPSAERWECAALDRAEHIGLPRGPVSVCQVKAYAAWVRPLQGDDAASRRLGVEITAIGHEHGYAYWTTLGGALAAAGTPGGAPDREYVERCIAALRLMGHECLRTPPTQLATSVSRCR